MTIFQSKNNIILCIVGTYSTFPQCKAMILHHEKDDS